MKLRKKYLVQLFLFVVVLLGSCKENVDTTARYVFVDKTIMDYLKAHEQYSEYVKLLSKVHVSKISETTLNQLLSARGHYTVFAPTDAAIQNYLDTLYKKGLINKPSWEGVPNEHTLDSIEKVIVMNSIIDGGETSVYNTYDFPSQQDAEIPVANMYDRRLVIHYTEVVDSILVNDASIDMRNRNIPLLNGVIHAVNAVVAPSNNTLGQLLLNTFNERRPGFYVASMLTKACGLIDTLSKYKDFVFEDKVENGIIVGIDPYPEQRYYGYTFFAETDSFWQATLGKNPLDITPSDVTDYLDGIGVYPDAKNDTAYKHQDNLLNRFVTYHLLPERLATDRLVYHRNEKGYSIESQSLGASMSEFYTTMGKRCLLKIFESRESMGIYLNRFPQLDNTPKGTYREVSCEASKEGILVGQPNLEGENNVRNGIIYPIQKLLVYDERTRSELQKQRIRWDVSAMFPELANNNYRMGDWVNYLEVFFPPNNLYKYLDDADIGQDMRFYYRYFGYGNNYLHDEFLGKNIVDITLRMPPVPRRGTYEVRLAVKMDAAGGATRGIYQFYWGIDKERLAALGIPVNFRLSGDEIGWEADTNDEEYNAMIDKRMRNHDFMKGPALYSGARAWSGASRRIIVRQTMDPDQTYYLRFKTVEDNYTRSLYMDYIEYCAKEVYDNPDRPEDVW